MGETFENKDFNANGVGLKNDNIIEPSFGKIVAGVCCFPDFNISAALINKLSCLAC